MSTETTPTTPPMQVAITTITETNFGDHGAMMRRAHTYDPDERVEDLMLRLLRSPYQKVNASDWIELRVVVGTEPEITPDGAPF